MMGRAAWPCGRGGGIGIWDIELAPACFAPGRSSSASWGWNQPIARFRSKLHAGCVIRRIVPVCCRPCRTRRPRQGQLSGRVSHHSAGWRGPVDPRPRSTHPGRRRRCASQQRGRRRHLRPQVGRGRAARKRGKVSPCLEQSPLGKAMADLDFRFRSVNPALCAMLGYTRSGTDGRGTSTSYISDDQRIMQPACGSLIDGSAPQIQVEERFLRKSGDPLWVNVNVAPIRDRWQHPLYARRHREHRRSPADDRDSAGKRNPSTIAEQRLANWRKNAAPNWRPAGRSYRPFSSTRWTG